MEIGYHFLMLSASQMTHQVNFGYDLWGGGRKWERGEAERVKERERERERERENRKEIQDEKITERIQQFVMIKNGWSKFHYGQTNMITLHLLAPQYKINMYMYM